MEQKLLNKRETFVRCNICGTLYEDVRPSPVDPYSISVICHARVGEYATISVFACEECINKIVAEIEDMVGTKLMVKSPREELRTLDTSKLDAKNRQIRDESTKNYVMSGALKE